MTEKLRMAKATLPPDPDPRLTVWAVYLSNVEHSIDGIELYATYREALESAASFYEIEIEDLDDETAHDEITEAAGSECWYVQEVPLP